VFPGKHYLDWTLDDPVGMSVEDVRFETISNAWSVDCSPNSMSLSTRDHATSGPGVQKGAVAALVIGSSIAAQPMSSTDVCLQLLENAAATAVALFAIILMFGPVSVGLSWREVLALYPCQNSRISL
jgi:hypothetical protein